MRKSDERGFTLIEIMITLGIVGVLAGIAIPAFMSYTEKAKGTEAVLQLNKIGRNAIAFYRDKGTFPQGTAAVLPGPDGGACSEKDRKFPPSSEWGSDPIWSDLDHSVGDRAVFSYHYESTSPTTARAWAVADPSCSGERVLYELVLQGRSGGNVESRLVDPVARKRANAAAPQTGGGESGSN